MKKGKWKVSFKIELDGLEVDFDELPGGTQRGILALVTRGRTEGSFYITEKGDIKRGVYRDD